MSKKLGSFITLVATFCLLCLPTYSQASEADEAAMSNLASYANAGQAITFVLEQLKNADSNSELVNDDAINALKTFQAFKNPYDEMSTISELTSGTEYSLNQMLADDISAALMYNNFLGWMEESSFSLDVLSLATDSYSFVQNIGKVFDDGSTSYDQQEAGLSAGLALVSAYSASAGIAKTLAAHLPSSTMLSFWGSNKLATWVGTNLGPKSLAGGPLTALTMGLQIQAAIYSGIRDGDIEDIASNYAGIYKDNITQRELVARLLTDLYLKKTSDGETVGYTDIYDSLFHYPTTVGKYAFAGQKFVAQDIFNNYYSNSSYLAQHFTVTSFAELTNEQRILLALNVLVEMAVVEDDEMKNYLTRTLSDGTKFIDTVYSAVSGSSIFDIYDSRALLQKIFPYYDTDMDSFEYYNIIFKAGFMSEVATWQLQKQAQIGKELRRLEQAAKIKAENGRIYDSMLRMDGLTAGDSIALSFYKDIEYLDKLNVAAELNEPVWISYHLADGTPGQHPVRQLQRHHHH